ncbi:AzlC family ABC transporter permease [Sporolactobacillus sp. KGMB 08714]|uniref:AzlC family ABC transporter permease n=1 Tax=Sporolactobacillus sp. KGMB 08714 TaxID=3064704 RepID=UPI002FBE935B
MNKMNALKTAFPYTLPICTGFLVLGLAYGIYMNSEGFSFIYPMLMSLTIFAGSMEFVTVNLLMSSFNPIYAFLLTLMVNARHLFYGISMLEKYKDTGKKKWYLIFGLCDESFSINYSVTPPKNVDKGWFMFFVTLLNHFYWVAGATLGGILGNYIKFNTRGIDFVLTALFVVIFLSQWTYSKNHLSSSIGILSSAICLFIFGSGNFMIPAMMTILLSLTILKNSLKRREEAAR